MKRMKFCVLTSSILLVICLLTCQASYADAKHKKGGASVKKSVVPATPKHEPLSLASLGPKEFEEVMSDMNAARSNRGVINVIERKFPERSLMVLYQMRQWAMDPDVQKALVQVLRPKYSQAPYYWGDQQIIDCTLFQTDRQIKQLRLQLEKVMRETKVEIALDESEKYHEFRPDIREKLIAHQLPATSDWVEAYTELAHKKRTETIRKCIFRVAGELSKNESLSLQDIGLQTMQDPLVQKILVDSMTPMPVPAFASFTEKEITEFVKSAGIIFGEILGEALISTSQRQ